MIDLKILQKLFLALPKKVYIFIVLLFLYELFFTNQAHPVSPFGRGFILVMLILICKNICYLVP